MQPRIIQDTNTKFSSKKLEIGDIFSEIHSSWIHILDIKENGEILSLETEPSIPDRIVVYKNFNDFEQSFKYGTIPGYSINYMGKDINRTKRKFKMYYDNTKEVDSKLKENLNNLYALL